MGYREHAGHRLIPAEDGTRLEKQVCQAILAAPTSQLAKEPALVELLDWVLYVEGDGGREPLQKLIDDPSLLAALLARAASEAVAGPLRDAAVTRQNLLPWNWLCKTFGEERLKTRVNKLADSALIQTLDGRALRAIALAQQYAAGWRPEGVFGLGSELQAADDTESATE